MMRNLMPTGGTKVRSNQRFSASIALSVLCFCVGPFFSPAEGCSSFTLVNNGSAVFAANYDNEIHEGMLYYEDSLGTWLMYRDTGNPNCNGSGDSQERFCTVAGRVDSFRSTTTGDAVDYAFETLGIVDSRTPWSVVFDTGNLRAYFRTQPYDEIRFVDLLEADLEYRSPAQMLDVHEELSGDITRSCHGWAENPNSRSRESHRFLDTRPARPQIG